ncbi:hypothetical protein V2J09_010746 [Rumex salicifolius]
MPERIFKATTRSLELGKDCFVKHHGFTLKLAFYPKCTNPDHVLGITPHYDESTFTTLLQDQQGLQIMANGCWFDVLAIPRVVFFNVRDLMEFSFHMSGMIYFVPDDEVVTSANKESVSVAILYNPSIFKEIGPVNELLAIDRPQLYKKTNI